MAKSAILVQFLAIIGLAAVIGGAHSMFVPIRLARESSGFVVPGAPETTQSGPDAATGEDQTPDPADGQTPDDSAQPSTGQPAAAQPAAAETGDGKLDLATAFMLHERAMNGEAIWFLDARRREDYDAGRIAGALFMAHTAVSSGEGLDELMAFSPPELNDPLIIYCTGGDCQASEDTAILLEAAGYSNIAIMSAGYDEWTAAGYPTEGP